MWGGKREGIKFFKLMNEQDKDFVFSESVKAGKRIYYFDVKQSRNGDKYIAITESKKIMEGSFDNPRISFEKHKIFLYKEDYDKFLNALQSVLKVAKDEVPVAEAKAEQEARLAALRAEQANYSDTEESTSEDVNIDINF